MMDKEYWPGDYILFTDHDGVEYPGTIKALIPHNNTCELILQVGIGTATVETSMDNIRPVKVRFVAH